MILISVIIVSIDAIILMIRFGIQNEFQFDFWTGTAVGYLFVLFCSFMVGYKYVFKMEKRLSGYNQYIFNALRNEIPIQSLNLQPLNQLPYSNPEESEILFYEVALFNYYVLTNRPEELHWMMEDMYSRLQSRMGNKNNTLNIYIALFYYSSYEVNARRAQQLMQVIQPHLQLDEDANAKRILAYYAFNIEHETQKAWEYLRQARTVVEEFSIDQERELEKMWINQLQQIMQRSEENGD